MSTPIRASDRDLRALAGIVSQDRPDLPDGAGLPPSLLADLQDQIRCDRVVLIGFDRCRQVNWFTQFTQPYDRSHGISRLPGRTEETGTHYSFRSGQR